MKEVIMVSRIKLNEFDGYAFLQSLGNFLKTDIEVSSGTIERKVSSGGVRRETRQGEGHSIKVTVSNTAPIEPQWPSVVLTGIGLTAEYVTDLMTSPARESKVRDIFRAMERQERLKVDRTNVPKINPFRKEGVVRVVNETFPHITNDESKHGDYLFPGQSIVYEMSLTLKECPDINDMRFWVEGTISRRHLFHCNKELTPSSG